MPDMRRIDRDPLSEGQASALSRAVNLPPAGYRTSAPGNPDGVPTAAQIQLALANATAARLTYGEKAILLDAAIDNALVTSSGTVELPWTTVGADGASTARMTLPEAVDLAVRLRRLDSGGVVSQPLEFRSDE